MQSDQYSGLQRLMNASNEDFAAKSSISLAYEANWPAQILKECSMLVTAARVVFLDQSEPESGQDDEWYEEGDPLKSGHQSDQSSAERKGGRANRLIDLSHSLWIELFDRNGKWFFRKKRSTMSSHCS